MNRVLLLICLCLKYAMFAEVKVKDNETLIYQWDVHHKIYYYCQFGTREQINRSFEPKCFRRNMYMQHILPDGTVTFPYAKYGSEKSFVLKCGDIQHAELHGCSKLLYKTCKYTCKGSSVTKNITCQLRGPTENVTAQWSVDQPCGDNPGHFVSPVASIMGNLIGKVNTDSVIDGNTTRVTVPIAAANSSSSSEFQTTQATDVETVPMTASAKFTLTTVLASTLSAVFALGVVAILLFVVYKYLRKRKRKKSRITFKQISSPEKISYNDSIIMFSKCDGESKQPLVVIGGEDNLQKSPSDTDVNTSEASSEVIQTAGIVNQEDDKSTSIAGFLDDFESMRPEDIDDIRISSLNNFESTRSGFSSWENTTELIKEDKVAELHPAPPRPEQCCASVRLLLEQPGRYRRLLQSQLEVISERLREQTLIGYMEQNMTLYGYQSRNELMVIEQTYIYQKDDKVSDYFLRVLSGHGVKIGYIVEYFYEHKNLNAINVILQVHTNCPYCEMFRR